YFSRLFLTTSWILSLLMMLLLDSRCGTSPLLLIHPSCLRKQTAIAAVRGIRPPFFLRQGDIVTVRHVPAVFQKKHQLQHVAHRNPRYGSCLVETPRHRSDPAHTSRYACARYARPDNHHKTHSVRANAHPSRRAPRLPSAAANACRYAGNDRSRGKSMVAPVRHDRS